MSKVEDRARRVAAITQAADEPATITRAQEFRRQAHERWGRANALAAKHLKAKTSMVAGEQRLFDSYMDEFDGLIDKAERMEAEVAKEKDKIIAERALRDGEGGGLVVELRDGRKLRAIPPGESVVEQLPELRAAGVVPDLGAEQDRDLPSFGALLRASVRGARTPAEHRAISGSSVVTGGIMVPSALSAQVIDDTRRASRVVSAGAGTLVIPDGGSLVVAMVVGDLTPGWRGESAAVPESEPSFAGHSIVARSLAVQCAVPVELLEDATNMDGQLRALFAEAFAGEVDRVALRGAAVGSEPGGVLSYTDTELAHPIPTVDMGAAAGAALTSYAPLVNAQYEIAAINGPPPTTAIMHPRTDKEFALLVSAIDAQPLRKPEALANLRFATSTRVPITDTHGTATDASRIYLGGWSELLLCMRTELQVMALKELKMASNLQIVFVAYLRMDVAVLRTNRFCIIEGVIPPA